MEKRRPVTEDDCLLTELLIGRSFSNLQGAVARSAASSLCSVGGHLKKHPVATAGAAVGAGILLFGLFRLMTRGGNQESGRSRQGMPAGEIASLLLPIVAPYIAGYLKEFLGKNFPRSS